MFSQKMFFLYSLDFNVSFSLVLIVDINGNGYLESFDLFLLRKGWKARYN